MVEETGIKSKAGKIIKTIVLILLLVIGYISNFMIIVMSTMLRSIPVFIPIIFALYSAFWLYCWCLLVISGLRRNSGFRVVLYRVYWIATLVFLIAYQIAPAIIEFWFVIPLFFVALIPLAGFDGIVYYLINGDLNWSGDVYAAVVISIFMVLFGFLGKRWYSIDYLNTGAKAKIEKYKANVLQHISAGNDENILLVITDVDYAPKDLEKQLPIAITLIKEMRGSDRPDYWLAKHERAVKWGENTVNYLVISARFAGVRLQKGIGDNVAINIAYVTDESLINDDELVFTKCQYIAIGSADEIK